MISYKYTIKDLLTEFEKNGLKISRSWIYRQEQKGNLILNRSTTNFKKAKGNRKIGAVRLLSEIDLKEIIKAFLPNGRGYYKSKEIL